MTRMNPTRGVSLVEALVALAVMAFGMLGVVGMQATLRFNADISKQRSEAVRMAQEQLEDMRAFAVLPVTAGTAAFGDIGTGVSGPTAVASTYANSSFERTVTIGAINSTDPSSLKTVTVQVNWLDRRTTSTGPAQFVLLTSAIAGVAPEVGASLSIPGDRSAPPRPRRRHSTIPPGAVDQGNGTSSFAPPGAGAGVSWTFVNATGLISNLCSAPGVCTGVAGWLLSGYIQFMDIGVAPTPALAENPLGAGASYPSIGMQVTLTVPAAPTVPPVCYASSPTLELAYYCFVPTELASWSGRSALNGGISSLLATNMATDATATRFKVCRYTPQATHTPSPGGNQAHPLDYASVTSSLVNQNFLVFNAGDGTTAFLCPGDDTSTPLINGTTFAHQPST